MRLWLRRVANDMNITFAGAGLYPYSKITDWNTRAQGVYRSTLSRTPGFKPKELCFIIGGHIRIKPVTDRPHEALLGAVITTTRFAYDTLASKYFHRTDRLYLDDKEKLKNPKSKESRLWFLHWQDYDPCEQLRYYDNIDTCDSSRDQIASRVKQIADRIDCVVDTDDPQPDLDSLCRRMKLTVCPKYPSSNRAGSKDSGYKEIFAKSHIKGSLARIVWVTQLLRSALMKKRCRLWKGDKGGHIVGAKGMAAARFPFTNCGR